MSIVWDGRSAFSASLTAQAITTKRSKQRVVRELMITIEARMCLNSKGVSTIQSHRERSGTPRCGQMRSKEDRTKRIVRIKVCAQLVKEPKIETSRNLKRKRRPTFSPWSTEAHCQI